jgi:hypothetical protein
MFMASLFLPFWHHLWHQVFPLPIFQTSLLPSTKMGVTGLFKSFKSLWAAPVESMAKEVPKGGGDLSDLLKSVTVVVF